MGGRSAVLGTAVGIGTCGLGADSGKADVADVAFREWCAAKATAQRSSLPPLLSPREFNKELLAGLETSKAHDLERRQQIRLETQAETKRLLEQAQRDRDELTAARRSMVSTTKATGHDNREKALKEHEAGRTAELQEVKKAMAIDRDAYQQIADAEKQRQKARVDAVKAQLHAARQAAAAQRETDRVQKLEAIRLEKEKDHSRIQQWRAVNSQFEVERKTDTQSLRTELNKGVSESKAHHHDELSTAVTKVKQEKSATLNELHQRRERHTETVRTEVAEVKRQQVSAYAEKIEELMQQKRVAAQELREKSTQAKKEAIEDRQRRREEARERKRYVTNSSSTTTPKP